MLLNLLTPSEKLVGFSGSLDVSLFPCGLWTCPHPCSVALQVFKMSIAQTCRSAPAAVLKPCWRRCPGRRPGPEHALPTGALEGDRPGNYTTTPQHGDVCSWALPDQKQPPHPVNHFFEMCKNEMGKNMFPIVVTKIGTQTWTSNSSLTHLRLFPFLASSVNMLWITTSTSSPEGNLEGCTRCLNLEILFLVVYPRQIIRWMHHICQSYELETT